MNSAVFKRSKRAPLIAAVAIATALFVPRASRATALKLCFRPFDERNFGYSAAHETDPLPLLPSGPGGVCGESLHRARSSTLRQSATRQLQIKILAHGSLSATLHSAMG